MSKNIAKSPTIPEWLVLLAVMPPMSVTDRLDADPSASHDMTQPLCIGVLLSLVQNSASAPTINQGRYRRHKPSPNRRANAANGWWVVVKNGIPIQSTSDMNAYGTPVGPKAP
ncbi:hypothetical protein VTK26DRAFT_5580 [Humicola hyalothermophila]